MARLPGVAAIAKRVAGIDRRRALPSFARKTFRSWFAGRSTTAERTGNEVLLWVDTFTEYLTPEVGVAAVRVLEQAGYTVRIVEQPVCCGLTWISTGQLDAARKRLSATVSALDDAAQRAVPIVGLEPSCTAVLREDLPGLLPDDPRAARVAATTVSLAELLARTPGWTAPDLSAVTAVAQPHCHHRAVLGWETDAALLRDAKVDVTAVGGCCGLAGNFGFEQGHYDVSVAVAGNALLPALRARPDAAVLADGYSCRTQVEQLDGRRARHLAELLAERLDA
jgi:Fe-S oxidoreductase